MAASGNSIATKSFQSFMVNEGLLAKVVEAVKAGEKDARNSGIVKSFEVFYKGFRQNISIGRIFIVPVKVASNLKDFPVALLYGTVVRELNLGEEVADLIEKKIGESEFDEYSQLDIQKLKDTLFYDVQSEEYRSLILFAPNWTNTREYVVFKYTEDDNKLANLLRHQVFSAYFNPAVSGAFDALMTTVDTNKLDITDITPKLTYPFITENPLKAYPDLQKQGGWAKKKIFLTVKTADAITKEVLDPQELNVFEALDSALTEATFPQTDSMEEVADFKGPSGHNEGNIDIPEVDVPATLTKGAAGDDTTDEEWNNELQGKMKDVDAIDGKFGVVKTFADANRVRQDRQDWKSLPVVECKGEFPDGHCGQRFYQEVEGQNFCRDCYASSHLGEGFYDQNGREIKTAKVAAMNCTICGKPVTLTPSAKERAKTFGGSPDDYTKLFTTHATCQIEKRNRDTSDLIKSKGAADDGTEMRRRPDYGEKGSYTQQMNEENEKTAAFDRAAVKCKDCGNELDTLGMCPNLSGSDARMGMQFCGKGFKQDINLWNPADAPRKGIQTEPEAPVQGRLFGSAEKKATPAFDRNATVCPNCNKELDGLKLCRNAMNGHQFCTATNQTSPNIYLGEDFFSAPKKDIKREPARNRQFGSDKAASTWLSDLKKTDPKLAEAYAIVGKQPRFALQNMVRALSTMNLLNTEEDEQRLAAAKYILQHSKSASAPFEVPFTNVGPGSAAHDSAEKAIAVKVDSISTKGEAPIGIELDKTGLPVHDKVAAEIMRDLDTSYVAMSTKAKAAAKKREDELNKKYAGRQKKADVPLTEESIWSDLMEDFGEAPQVELPGEGSGHSDSEATTDKGESKPVEKSVETEEKSEPKGPKSKLFQNKNKPKEEPKKEAPKAEAPKSEAPKKEEPKTEEPKEEKKEEPKEASKTAMLYMNDYDIELAKQRFANDPVLSAAANFLSEFKEEVDSHSDGWAHWRPPVQAAAQLMTLIQSGRADQASLAKALAPIKAFMTRRGLAAGMTMPSLKIRKGAKSLVASAKIADEVQSDIAEAKSKVVSPDTVDATIKQPTDSVEEAAKVATPGVKTVKVVGAVDQYPGEHGCRTYVGKTDTQGQAKGEGHVCMKPETVKIEGRMYCDEHRPDKKNKKKGADVSSDISEAKSEVVSPDTVDSDIKQPTVSVPEAAKVAGGHKHKCPDCKKTLTCNNPKDCPGEGKEALCGSCPEPKKKKADVSGDISEAKSKVVSPDTVDSDIKQPTKSVSEAAKVAAPERDPSIPPEADHTPWQSEIEDQKVEQLNSEDDSCGVALGLAQRLIDRGDEVAQDVAVENGQVFENVKGMDWFVQAVADKIEGDEITVGEYLDNKEADEAEEIAGGVVDDGPDEEYMERHASSKVAGWGIEYDDLTSAGKATLGRITRSKPDLLKQYGYDEVLEAVYESTSHLGHLEEIGSSDVSIWVEQVAKELERTPPQEQAPGPQEPMEAGTSLATPDHTAAAGDENDEEVEMGLADGDLADLGANLPSPLTVVTAELHPQIPTLILVKKVRELNEKGLYTPEAVAEELNVPVDRIQAVIEIIKGMEG